MRPAAPAGQFSPADRISSKSRELGPAAGPRSFWPGLPWPPMAIGTSRLVALSALAASTSLARGTSSGWVGSHASTRPSCQPPRRGQPLIAALDQHRDGRCCGRDTCWAVIAVFTRRTTPVDRHRTAGGCLSPLGGTSCPLSFEFMCRAPNPVDVSDAALAPRSAWGSNGEDRVSALSQPSLDQSLEPFPGRHSAAASAIVNFVPQQAFEARRS
jgi:hypothetical protein